MRAGGHGAAPRLLGGEFRLLSSSVPVDQESFLGVWRLLPVLMMMHRCVASSLAAHGPWLCNSAIAAIPRLVFHCCCAGGAEHAASGRGSDLEEAGSLHGSRLDVTTCPTQLCCPAQRHRHPRCSGTGMPAICCRRWPSAFDTLEFLLQGSNVTTDLIVLRRGQKHSAIAS